MTDLHYVLLSAALTWTTLMTASLVRARAWTMPGLILAFGNREDLPALTPLTGRLDRAARNTMENFVFLAVVVGVAHLRGIESASLVVPCAVFFGARALYVPVYAAGITYVRTAIWLVGVAAIAWIAWIAW